MNNKTILKRLTALLLSVITLVTMFPITIPTFAASNTDSGQTKIINGNNYGLKSSKIYYSGWSVIPEYDKGAAKNSASDNGSGTTSVLQKYLTSTGDVGSGKLAVPQDVPVYRLSRPGGYTDSDTNLAGVTIIDATVIDDFIYYANLDADKISNTNSRNNAKIDYDRANMIHSVLVNGYKKPKASGGVDYSKEQLYDLATQILIWEIQEGKKRLGE